MRNRIMSLILLFAVIFSIAPINVHASSKYISDVKFNKESSGRVAFEISFEGEEVSPEDKLNIETPIAIDTTNLEQYFTVDYEEENGLFIYTLTPHEQYNTVQGRVFGEITQKYGEEQTDIVINGETVSHKWGESPSTEGETAERENIYKVGEVQGDKVKWEIHIKNPMGPITNTTVTDILGDGQVNPRDFTVSYIRGNDYIEVEKIENIGYKAGNISDPFMSEIEVYDNNSFSFEIKELPAHDVIYISFLADITEEYRNQPSFENELQVGEGKKTVEILNNSGSEVEVTPKPEPTEPENPDPDNPEPTEPDNPEPTDPNLPQVGEEFNILAIGLLAVGLFKLIRSER